MNKRPQFAPRHPPPPPDAITAARNQAKLSMPQAAELCEVSPLSWESWEEGRKRMPAPVWKLFNLLTKEPHEQIECLADVLEEKRLREWAHAELERLASEFKANYNAEQIRKEMDAK